MGFGLDFPGPWDYPYGAGSFPCSSCKVQGPQEGSEELWSLLISTGRRKGLGARGAMSLRVLHPLTCCFPAVFSPMTEGKGSLLLHVRHVAFPDQQRPPPVGCMTEAPQAQVSPQNGVSEPLLPGGPAHEARCIPWGQHSVSLSFTCSLCHSANLLHCPQPDPGCGASLCSRWDRIPILQMRKQRLRGDANPTTAWLRQGHGSPCSTGS